MAKKRRSRRLPSSVVDQVRLGPNAAAFKSRASSSQWRDAVRRAHGQGYTIDSYLDQDVPAPLKQRLKSSLRAEALSSISEAFAPAQAALSTQRQRAENVAEKRRIDNMRYREWLTSQYGQLNAHAQAADDKLLEANKLIAQQSQDAIAAARTQLVDNAAKDPSGVSDPAQAKAFNLQAEGERNAALIGNERQRTADAIGSSQRNREGQQNAMYAMVAGMEAKRQQELWSRLGEIGDDESKLEIDKAGAAAEEIARLMGMEVDKAAGNRDYRLAADRLGVQQDQLTLDTQVAADKAAADRREQDAEVAKDRDDFLAKMGVSPERWRKMSANQRLSWLRRLQKSKSTPGQKGKDKLIAGIPESQFRKLPRSQQLKRVQEWADAEGGTKKNKGAKADRKAYRTIADLASRIGHSDAQDPSKLSKHKANLRGGHNKDGTAYDVWLVQAAAEIAKYGKLKPRTYRVLDRGGNYVPPEWRP